MLDSKGLPAQKKKACAAKQNSLKETPEQKALKELLAIQGSFRVFAKEGHKSQTRGMHIHEPHPQHPEAGLP